MSLKLYWANGSIPSWRVLLALYEYALPFEGQRLKVMSQPKETRSAWFLTLNPRGKTPTLVDEGQVVIESLAILHYLERFHSQKRSLLPPDRRACATALARLQESENLSRAYSPIEELFLPLDSLSGEQRAEIKASLATVYEELAIWEGYLAGSAFLAAPTAGISLADMAFYPVLAYLVRRGARLERFPNLTRYYQEVSSRPSAAQAQPVGWAIWKISPDLFSRAAAL
jgi:glutathione S-transferase